jgi:hypothetical protein
MHHHTTAVYAPAPWLLHSSVLRAIGIVGRISLCRTVSAVLRPCGWHVQGSVCVVNVGAAQNSLAALGTGLGKGSALMPAPALCCAVAGSRKRRAQPTPGDTPGGGCRPEHGRRAGARLLL